ncbi:MAG: tRNA pseudouridine(38-40) synthase TruA [Phycisphaerae bacterium]
MRRTIYLLVAYDGTEFHGWQRQLGVRTVQEVLEQAVRRVVRHQVDLIGSGRTDTGVHAAGHVNSFVTTCELEPDRMRHAIGSRLPKDVSIAALREVHPDFGARRSAISKLYRYRIYNARGRPVEHQVHLYTYHFWQPLDVDRMRAAARHFLGERDFTAVAATGTERLSTVRTVLRCDVERHMDEIRIDIEGTGFLYKQVRRMVGTLVNVGRGQWEPDRVAEILESRDRTKAGPTTPARGLCMQWVRYPPHLLTLPTRTGEGDTAHVTQWHPGDGVSA